MAQTSKGKNPYCDVCVSLIWRIAQKWRNCKCKVLFFYCYNHNICFHNLIGGTTTSPRTTGPRTNHFLKNKFK